MRAEPRAQWTNEVNIGPGTDQAVLGIRDILVRIRIPGSGPLTNGLDPAPDLNPTPDPTPFFIYFKDEKKISFFS
jgi:hypothetical protein